MKERCNQALISHYLKGNHYLKYYTICVKHNPHADDSDSSNLFSMLHPDDQHSITK